MAYKVSAVISTYNSARFIRKRLLNLVNQSIFKKGQLQIIVVDSRSPENEGQIVEEFQQQFNHIIYKRTPERETLYKAWNRGIDLMTGDYFINANTDDRFAPNALEILADTLDNDWYIDAAYGNWLYTHTENDEFDSPAKKVLASYPPYFPPLFIYFQLSGHACMIRKSVFEEIGPFDPSYKVYGDREFMLRFGFHGKKALHTGETIGLYLENKQGIYHSQSSGNEKEFQALMEHYFKKNNLLKLFGYNSQNNSLSHAQLLDYVVALSKNELFFGDKPYFASEMGAELARQIYQSTNGTYTSARFENNCGIFSVAHGRYDQARNHFEKALSQSLSHNSTDRICIPQIAENRRQLRTGQYQTEAFNWISINAAEFSSGYSFQKKEIIQTQRDQRKKEKEYQKLVETVQKCLQTGHLEKAHNVINKHKKSAISRADLNALTMLILTKTNRTRAVKLARDTCWGNMDHREIAPVVINRMENLGWHQVASAMLDRCFAKSFDWNERLRKKWFENHYQRGHFAYLITRLKALEPITDSIQKMELTCYLQKALRAQWRKKQGEFKNYSLYKPKHPLVSVIISTYNAERFIEGRLQNILMQTIADETEIIVIDSGSRQNEAKIVQSYQQRFKNIKLIQTERETVYKAWNRGIKAAGGTYITNGNTDDRLRLDALECMVQVFESQPDTALVYPNVLRTRNEQLIFDPNLIHGFFDFLSFHAEILVAGYCYIGPMPMWKRQIHEEIGYFDEQFITSGDFEFWTRMTAQVQHCQMKNINSFLGLYLESPDSIEHRHTETKAKENNSIKDRYDSWQI